MSEQLQTRTEYSRSVEDAKKYKALETLKEVGLLIPVSDIETYHGRVASEDAKDEWSVDPSFANGSNDSGNDNVNKRPTLYSGEKDVAEEFANERIYVEVEKRYMQPFNKIVANYSDSEREDWRDRENVVKQRIYKNTPDRYKPYTDDALNKISWLEARRLESAISDDERYARRAKIEIDVRKEVHEITTADTDATILDSKFDETKLDEETRSKYREALRALVIPITEGSPVGFEDCGQVQPFVAAIQQTKKNGYLYTNDVTELAAIANIDERVSLQIASASNARLIAQVTPSYLVDQLLECSTDIFTANLDVDGEKQEVPINLEYVERFLRASHIVGVKQSINSATVGRKITSVSFFDLEKTSTRNDLEAERKSTWQRLGKLATSLGEYNEIETYSVHPLLHLLTDVNVKPEKLLAAAKEVEGYDAIFEADAGNWEGFTLAEHTETVLRNFDESFADNLPVGLLAPMRLAILSHDVGKPIAAARGEKHKQMEYNVAQANDFLSKLDVDDKFKDLLIAVIGGGKELAFQIEVRGAGEPTQEAMKKLATEALCKFYDIESVSDEQITGFTEMCKMLQICDGGAYTSMAVTRSTVKGIGRYRNAPLFNNSFAQPVGFGKRNIRLRKEGDKAAESDLTPKAVPKD